MLLTLLAGLLVALVTLPFVPGSTSYRWVFLAAPVLLVCLYPKVLNQVLGWLLRLARQPALEQPLSGRAVAGALAWALVSWACFGLQIWAAGDPARRTIRSGGAAGDRRLRLGLVRGLPGRVCPGRRRRAGRPAGGDAQPDDRSG
jgi:hypothetical protein